MLIYDTFNSDSRSNSNKIDFVYDTDDLTREFISSILLCKYLDKVGDEPELTSPLIFRYEELLIKRFEYNQLFIVNKDDYFLDIKLGVGYLDINGRQFNGMGSNSYDKISIPYIDNNEDFINIDIIGDDTIIYSFNILRDLRDNDMSMYCKGTYNNIVRRSILC